MMAIRSADDKVMVVKADGADRFRPVAGVWGRRWLNRGAIISSRNQVIRLEEPAPGKRFLASIVSVVNKLGGRSRPEDW
jgi:hypothetical protein